MSNLKAGQDAMIVNSVVNLNLGKRVKTIRIVGDLQQMQEYDIGDGIIREAIVDGLHWLVVPLDTPLVNANGYETFEAVYPASWLQPFQGLGKTDEESVDKVLETVL